MYENSQGNIKEMKRSASSWKFFVETEFCRSLRSKPTTLLTYLTGSGGWPGPMVFRYLVPTVLASATNGCSSSLTELRDLGRWLIL